MKTKIFTTLLILIIAGLSYLLLTDTDLIPGKLEIGISNETDQDEETVLPIDEIEAPEIEIETNKDEEGTVDSETDETIDDEEPAEMFEALEVTDEYLGSTFENTVYGYTVDFPENWYWERLESDFLGNREDYLWLDPNTGFAEGEYPGMAHINVLDSTLTQELQQRDDWNQSYTLTELTIDGVSATRVEYDISDGFWTADVSVHIYIEQNELLYEIGMWPDGQDEELLQRILNSFKFI